MITDLLHYKIAYKIKMFIKNDNHSNIIIYGKHNSGKTYLIKKLFLITGKKFTNDNFHLNITKNYYYFDCKSIKDKSYFINYLKDIIKKYDYFTFTNKYIILDHYEYSSDLIQNSLKVIIENAVLTCKFIIITNNIGKVCCPIKSRSITIRIPQPTSFNKYIYLKDYFFNNNIFFTDYHLLKDCLIRPLNEIINIYTYDNYFNIKDTLYQKFEKNIFKEILTKEDILEIKKLSSEIKELNIPFQEFLKKLILKVNNKEIIYLCKDREYDIINSYRELIHIEGLILKLNSILYKKINM